MTDMRVARAGGGHPARSAAARDARRSATHLDRFVFSEDVQVEDVTSARAEIGLYGRPRRSLVTVLVKAQATAALPLFGAPPSGSPASTRSSSGATRLGCAGYDVVRRRRGRGCVIAALLGGRRRPTSTRRRRRDRAHRERPAAVRRRHGHRHDSARSRHRGARDLAEQGLLRRAGSDRPRPGSRPRARGEAAASACSRPAAVAVTRSRRRRRKIASGRARKSPDVHDARGWSPRSLEGRQLDRARLRPPRLRRAGRPCSVDAVEPATPRRSSAICRALQQRNQLFVCRRETPATVRSSRVTQRISWPSSGRGSSRRRAGEEVQLDAAIGVVVGHVTSTSAPTSTVGPELLFHLPPQAVRQRFAGLALAAGKLPIALEVDPCRPPRDRNTAVLLDDRRGDDDDRGFEPAAPSVRCPD